MIPAGIETMITQMMIEFPSLTPEAIKPHIRFLTAPKDMENCDDAYFIECAPGSTASLWLLSDDEIETVSRNGCIWANVHAGGKTQPPIAIFTHWDESAKPAARASGPAHWREMLVEAEAQIMREAINELKPDDVEVFSSEGS